MMVKVIPMCHPLSTLRSSRFSWNFDSTRGLGNLSCCQGVCTEFLITQRKNMKSLAIFALSVAAIAIALPRAKRQAYDLPDGAELIVGPISTNFRCDGLNNGYYADVDNNCQVFHVCNQVTHADGRQETHQYSFFCGNQTVFNQLTLTCAWPEEAVPCANAREFFYVNDNIGIEDALFLRDEDVARANQYIQGKKK